MISQEEGSPHPSQVWIWDPRSRSGVEQPVPFHTPPPQDRRNRGYRGWYASEC